MNVQKCFGGSCCIRWCFLFTIKWATLNSGPVGGGTCDKHGSFIHSSHKDQCLVQIVKPGARSNHVIYCFILLVRNNSSPLILSPTESTNLDFLYCIEWLAIIFSNALKFSGSGVGYYLVHNQSHVTQRKENKKTDIVNQNPIFTDTKCTVQ